MALGTLEIRKILAVGTEPNTNRNPGWLSANLHDTPASYRIPIPDTGEDDAYSYECVLQAVLTALPDTAIENLKLYGPSVPPVAHTVVNWGITDTFAAPVSTVSSVATTRQDTNYYSLGTALSWTVQPADGLLDAINDASDYFYSQLQVEAGALNGTIPTQAVTLRYTES